MVRAVEGLLCARNPRMHSVEAVLVPSVEAFAWLVITRVHRVIRSVCESVAVFALLL
jgi:hypothetical protein